LIKAIAIDDEVHALQVIEIFCSKTTDLLQLEKTFNKPNDALKYINKFPVDLLFLDINMPSLNGLDLYKSIKQETMVIFTTAYSEYAVEGFNVNAIDYLLKPFTYERFLQAVQKASQQHNFQNQSVNQTAANFIYVRADYSLVKIDTGQILFIEGLDDYLKIHITGQPPVVARMTIKNLLEKLPANNFIRIHRSYVIAFNKIKSVRGKIVSVGDEELPVGSSYEENLLKFLNK
jgi:DNA-binding LytR/AlgR family response regulator